MTTYDPDGFPYDGDLLAVLAAQERERASEIPSEPAERPSEPQEPGDAAA